MQRKGGAAALLQKVNYQLKGERPLKTPDEEDEENLDAYFTSLTKRSNKPEIQWDKFGESDLELSEKEEIKPQTAGSKFLKKKPVANENDSPKVHVPKQKENKQKFTVPGQSSVLNKASAFTNKYAAAKSTNVKKDSMLSESDMDLSFSMDDDVLADIQNLKASKAAGRASSTQNYSSVAKSMSNIKSNPPKKTVAGVPRSVAPYHTSLADTDDESSSMQIGKGGSKFLKKTVQPEPAPEVPEEKFSRPTSKDTKPRSSMFKLKSSEKYSTQVMLDSEDESLQNFIGGLSESSGGAAPRTSAKSPAKKGLRSSPKITPRGILKTPRSARSVQSPSTMELISEEESDASYKLPDSDQESVSSAGSFKLNVMDLDVLDLAPVVQPISKGKKKKVTKEVKLDTTPRYIKEKPVKRVTTPRHIKEKPKKKESKTENIFEGFGLQTVDDLLGRESSESESEVSEIQTAGATSEIATIMDDSGRHTPLRSILSSPQPNARRSSSGTRRVSLRTDTARSRSPSPEIISTARGSRTSIGYEDDFEESIVTEQPSSIRTERDESDSDVDSYTRSSMTRSRRHSYTRTGDYYSDNGTSATETSARQRHYSRSSSQGSYSEDFTDYSETEYSRRSSSESTVSSSNITSSSSQSQITDSYTSSSLYTRTVSSSSGRTPSPSPRLSKPVKTRTREVQTGLDVGLVYHWNVQRGDVAALGHQYGLASVDPTPIATHIVGPDALEAMTAYSPSVLALNDMLRQQVQMTANFIETQKRLHRDLIRAAIVPDFNYTTLEDTKRYIKKNKKKPLSFKKALKQVKLEMNLE